MGKRISKYIPSMYQRRLLLLVGGMCVAGLLPALRMGQLTLAQGAGLRAEAERRLEDREWLDNVRGRIIDRRGRVLAMDRPTLNVAVDYDVITGEWADDQAARRARSQNRAKWATMTREQRKEASRAALPEFDAQLEAMWNQIARVSGVSREDIQAKRAEVRSEVQLLATQVTERKRRERERLLNRGSDDADADESLTPVLTSEVRRPVREESEAHVLLRDVPDAMGFEFQKLVRETIEPLTPGGRERPRYPGLRVIDAKRREYPLDTVDVPLNSSLLPLPLRRTDGEELRVRVAGVATHLVGWMRGRLFEEDVTRRPLVRADGSLDYGHYRAGDSVGQGGIEQAGESLLRGRRGVRVTHLDTGEVEVNAPVNGTDVQLTIDAMLQARAQALFDPRVGLAVVQPWHKAAHQDAPKAGELPLGAQLHGAAVIIDVATGDILAMVSAPSFSHEVLTHARETILNDTYTASYLNRAIDKPYPPGSIVKPLIFTSAVTAGKLGLDDRINCTGHFYPEKPTLFRCWIFKQFHTTHNDQLGHPLNGSDAIKVSCNIFFYELGRRLGPAGIHDLYTRFGVGRESTAWNLFGVDGEELPNAGLLHVHRGGVPDASKASSSEAVLMGIGQGPVLWTPLHAADAYATLARGGVRLTPRLRSDVTQIRADLGLDASSVRVALDGLKRCASEENGTTFSVTYEMPDGSKHRERIFDVPGVSVWAKSGTADAPPFVADLNFDQNTETFDGDHAWCVGLVGVGNEPKYAIAVVVDHGGSGGRVSGPVVNQLIHALVSEGYLPDHRGLSVGGAARGHSATIGDAIDQRSEGGE